MDRLVISERRDMSHRRRVRRWQRRADRQGVSFQEYFLRRLLEDVKHPGQFAKIRKLQDGGK